MRVFLSWSGPRSKHVAISLRDWLPLVLQAVDPWISVDIEKGERWDEKLSQALKQSKFCILCLTKENVKSQYLHYEAGAISNQEGSRNCTFLYDVKERDITNPLSSFQNTKFEKEDVYRLISDMNSMLGQAEEVNLKESLLRKNFDLHWPSLDIELKATPAIETDVQVRSDDDVLAEILQIVRGLNKTNVHIDTSSVIGSYEFLLKEVFTYTVAENVNTTDGISIKNLLAFIHSRHGIIDINSQELRNAIRAVIRLREEDV